MRTCTYNYWCLKCKNTNKSLYCSHCQTENFSLPLGTKLRAPGPGNNYQLKKFLTFIFTRGYNYYTYALLYTLYCIQNNIKPSNNIIHHDQSTTANIIKMFDIKSDYDLQLKCDKFFCLNYILNKSIDTKVFNKVFKMIKQL